MHVDGVLDNFVVWNLKMVSMVRNKQSGIEIFPEIHP